LFEVTSGRFGESFAWPNDNRNLVIHKKALDEFSTLTEDSVLWLRAIAFGVGVKRVMSQCCNNLERLSLQLLDQEVVQEGDQFAHI